MPSLVCLVIAALLIFASPTTSIGLIISIPFLLCAAGFALIELSTWINDRDYDKALLGAIRKAERESDDNFVLLSNRSNQGSK